MLGRVNYWAISIFWFGVSVHWAAFLTIVMQVRTAELVAPEIKGTMLGVLSAAGAFISTVIEARLRVTSATAVPRALGAQASVYLLGHSC